MEAPLGVTVAETMAPADVRNTASSTAPTGIASPAEIISKTNSFHGYSSALTFIENYIRPAHTF
jgi:hypothetical protein